MTEELTIEFNDQDQIATLWIGTTLPQVVSLPLPPGFGLADLHEALLVTGRVSRDGETLQLSDWISSADLERLLSAMFAQFTAPGEPSEQLVEVRSIVDDFASDKTTAEIPWMAIAWLVVTVADDVAEEARSSDRIWKDDRFTVYCGDLRKRRLRELVARYSPAAASTRLRRMSPSIQDMQADARGVFRAG